MKMRLDLKVAEKYNISRTKAKELIENGYIEINNTIIRKANRIIDLDIEKITILEIDKIINNKKTEIENQAYKDIKIISIEKEFIIIDKPPFLITHKSHERDESPTLADWYKESGFFIDYIIDEKKRVGIIHRLDKETSGLIILARTYNAQEEIAKLFHDRLVEKTYQALVLGTPPPQGLINFPILRNPLNPTEMITTNHFGRNAETYFKTIKNLSDYSLIECYPKTGRTHQIRVHCKAIGHEILGDKKYGKSSKLINRQALHAKKISFTYKEKFYIFEISLPEDMLCLI